MTTNDRDQKRVRLNTRVPREIARTLEIITAGHLTVQDETAAALRAYLETHHPQAYRAACDEVAQQKPIPVDVYAPYLADSTH